MSSRGEWDSSLAATLLALMLAQMLTRPIAALVRAARQVSQGTLDVDVEVDAHDEYRELGDAFNEMVASLRTSRQQLDRQVQENERLLLSLLPASGAAQVREGNAEARQSFADVTVAFINLAGFESLSPELDEDDSMALLSDIVAACDEAAEHHGVEKVRTIGSSYLAVSGLSVERPDHTARMVEFAREVVRIVKRFNAERGVQLAAEIGINTGPVVGGLDRPAQVHLRPLGRHGEARAGASSPTAGLRSWSPGPSTSACASWLASDRRRAPTFAASARSSCSRCSTRPRHE